MRIYFMSICGTGMGNGALLMRSLGHEVLGADQNTYPPMSERLAEAGVRIMSGYDARRLEQLAPDMVVVGNVNTRGNPEVEWLLENRAIPFVSLPELLAQQILSKRKSIVVSGTHGKTTTTSLTAYLLEKNGATPGYLIGGVPQDLPSGAEVGESAAPFVIEGDEYDSAFFDKRSKFIHYCPRILILNNLEFDHADIYRDLLDIQRSFSHLIKLVPSNGVIIGNSDDSNVESLLGVDWAPVIRVGMGDRADLKIDHFEEDEHGSGFDLIYRGKLWGHVSWQVWGAYNARNAAMAALAAGLSVYPSEPTRLKLDSLKDFKGVKRRQEILFEEDGLTVLTDFAHHPTAVSATLLSLRKRFPDREIVMCHEARSNTACRKIHQTDYALSFDNADTVFLGPVYRADRYAVSERIDMSEIAKRLGKKASSFGSNEELLLALKAHLSESRSKVVIFLSNGSFDGIPQQLVEKLRKKNENANNRATCVEVYKRVITVDA